MSAVRASDAERDRIAQLLQTAAAEGRLSPDEAGERLAAASTAKYRDELEHLVADLPLADVPPDRARRPGVPAWWVFGLARTAFAAMLLAAIVGFWGVRFFLWPLGFMAIAFLFRMRAFPRRRMHRWFPLASWPSHRRWHEQ